MRLTICDLDGTICDDRHRLHLIKRSGPDRWDDYHAACMADRFMNAGCVAAPQTILFFTARPEKYRAMTEAWLGFNGLCPRNLKMRGDHDHSPSDIIKERMLLEFVRTLPLGLVTLRSILVTAYDDRDDVLAVYRRYGIQTVKVTYEDEDQVYARRSQDGRG